MDLSKELYQQIRQDVGDEILEYEGRAYRKRDWTPMLEPKPAPIEVRTLTGLVDFIQNSGDVEAKDLICHVESYNKVSLYSKLFGDFEQRKIFIESNLNKLDIIFGSFISSEKMNIMLQSCFVSDPRLTDDVASSEELEQLMIIPTHKALLLQYTANVTNIVETGIDDDGITQAVSMKSGVSSKSNVALPNPVTLRPYRTFLEVEQPTSQFIFRVNSELQFSLHEADGGAWKNEAMLSIKKYLEKEVPTLTVLA